MRCAPCCATSASAIEINPRLVRGLDYYNRTVFEWITDSAGAQNAVCSGGRYDGLIAQLGGDATRRSALPWGSSGWSRCWCSRGETPAARSARRVSWSSAASRPRRQALQLVEQLRGSGRSCASSSISAGGNFKAQFRRADKSGAPLALILGDDELARGVVAMKPLRASSQVRASARSPTWQPAWMPRWPYCSRPGTAPAA